MWRDEDTAGTKGKWEGRGKEEEETKDKKSSEDGGNERKDTRRRREGLRDQKWAKAERGRGRGRFLKKDQGKCGKGGEEIGKNQRKGREL